jgi:hypothetical protein
VFEYVGCDEDDVACMMTKSVEEVLDAQEHAIKLDLKNLFLNFVPFAPMIESTGEIPEQPLYFIMKVGNYLISVIVMILFFLF